MSGASHYNLLGGEERNLFLLPLLSLSLGQVRSAGGILDAGKTDLKKIIPKIKLKNRAPGKLMMGIREAQNQNTFQLFGRLMNW